MWTPSITLHCFICVLFPDAPAPVISCPDSCRMDATAQIRLAGHTLRHAPRHCLTLLHQGKKLTAPNASPKNAFGDRALLLRTQRKLPHGTSKRPYYAKLGGFGQARITWRG